MKILHLPLKNHEWINGRGQIENIKYQQLDLSKEIESDLLKKKLFLFMLFTLLYSKNMSFRIRDVEDKKIFVKCSCSPSAHVLQLNMYYVLC